MTPIEPSEQMAARRPLGSPQAILGRAEELPLADGSVDAAMAVLSAHHFDDLERGLREMIRVSRHRVVVFTWDPDVLSAFWLVADYIPHIASDPRWRSAAAERVATLLGGRVQVVPIPHDSSDGFLGAYWRRPGAYLDPAVRAGISSLAGELPRPVAEGLAHLAADVAGGTWKERHADLLEQEEMDVGYRLVIADL